jgi:hypothetical protein
VHGPDLDRRGGHERCRANPRTGTGQAPCEEEDQGHAGDTEGGDDQARRQETRRIDGALRGKEGQDRRQQIDEETRILVEAMVEIARADHRPRGLDEDDLVVVRHVPEAPRQTEEPQQRGHDQDPR